MQQSKVPYFFLALAAVLAVSALGMLLFRIYHKPGAIVPHSSAAPPPAYDGKSDVPQTDIRETPGTQPVNPTPDPSGKDQGKGQGAGVKAADAPALVNRIAKAYDAGDFPQLSRLIRKEVMDEQAIGRIKEIHALGMRLRQPDGIREVGEAELNVRSRWALELESPNSGRESILLDLLRRDGEWSVDKILLPAVSGDPQSNAKAMDSLAVADAFLQAVLNQKFEQARAFVDPVSVSDAKIAGLCILFEEGAYHLRKSKPLRAMFQRQDIVGYLANLATTDESQVAQFALTLKQASDKSGWFIVEINLDQLLADYARRVAGGDVYYTPLVRNPAGGETLALYFGFDEDAINPRTRRQLEIVALILKSDPGKKLTLSGHTDSLGTEGYNKDLSERRADVVRDFLIQSGVAQTQIVTVAKGSSQPRRPNVTESGQDNPEGRRVNRRTEIYLDF